ncbi:hypothetical protein MVEG_04110 [Podila verticillata NRRL 6337]|nr:hypothetical protein MVEG_04110 [Podila verticillata NRRL 6337]
MNSLRRSIHLITPFTPPQLPPRVPLHLPPRTGVQPCAPRRAHTTSSSPLPELDKGSPPSKGTLKHHLMETISFFSCAYIGELGGAVIGEFIVGIIGEHIVDRLNDEQLAQIEQWLAWWNSMSSQEVTAGKSQTA